MRTIQVRAEAVERAITALKQRRSGPDQRAAMELEEAFGAERERREFIVTVDVKTIAVDAERAEAGVLMRLRREALDPEVTKVRSA